jgi:hypothetical protein
MKKQQRRAKKQYKRRFSKDRKMKVLFLGHHTRPATRFLSVIDWQIYMITPRFKDLYGKFSDSIYANSENVLLTPLKPFDLMGPIVSVPISYK